MKLKYILFIFTLIATSSSSFATSYTWVGTTSSWNLSSNWSPSGIPDSADNVTISSGTNGPLLDGNRKITNLTLSSKTIDLNGYSLTVYGTATMTSGTVTNGTFYARGNLASFNGTLMDCPVDAVCGYIRLSGSTFNETADFTDLGAATGTGSGGCTFNDDVTITHTGTLTYFTLANTTGDTFNGNVTFTNSSNREIHIAANGSTQFNGNIILNSTSTSGISFGNGGGSAILATGKSISIGTSGFAADFLTLKNFTQNGSTAQTLTLTGTAVVNIIGATFGGNITVTAPGILLKNSTFNGTATLTRNGSSGNHQSDGGNTFNNSLTANNAGSAGRIRWATTTPDSYNADATFSSTGGQDVQIAYSGDNTFAGNITINSNKVVFNTNTGKVKFTGTNNQTLNGSYNYPFKKLAINKTSGTVTANTTLSVDDSLIFIQGNLITTSTNLLTMKHGSTANGASNSSFVSGPVKKVGNSSFLFPIGSSNIYQPMAISAPGTTNSAFIGQYLVDSMLVNTSSRDTTLGYIYRDRYWNLIRETGSSNVYVTLSWQENHPIIDSNIVVVSWNGTKWIDIGKNQIIGSKLNGNTQSPVVATNYNEFSIGYSIANKPTTSCDCNDVQTAVCLVDCLIFATTPLIVSVTDDIELDQATWGAILPLPILDGVTLQGVSSGVVSKWWESNCPLITTDHTATYDPDYKYTMFLFAIEGNATIEGLRIRGSNLGFKDFNQPTILSGGFYTYGSPIMTMSATFRNIELSGFSYTAIFKSVNYDNVQIENCYIHKVKGIHYSGIGYGAWFQADRSGDQIIDINNTIFDDCKAAIDGQGRSPIMTIGDCTLSQFFHSEDINMHNSDDDFLFADCPKSSVAFNMRPSGDTFLPYEITPGSNFYSSYWDNTVNCINGSFISTPGKIKGPLNSTFSDLLLYPLASLPAGHIPFYDVDGYQTTIQNCIFHKSWKINGSGNISLRYPHYTLDPTNSFVNVSNCTFATEQFSASAIVDENGNNNAGFCKIADNYILAPVWASDPKIIVKDNSFSYKTGIPLSTTSSAQPFEMALSLIDGMSQLLPFSGTNSGSNHAPKIQFVEVNETFDLTLNMTNNGGSATPRYIVRSNPNNGDPLDNNISGLNFHFDDEFITDAPVPIVYNKPGLYGIDVMGFDVNDYGSTSEDYHFNASAWEHIPVIVVDPSEEQMLYFNIRDSYLLNGAASTTVGVKKRAYFNEELIWEEDIGQGGDGWEYVAVDFDQTFIKNSIKTDGSPNILSFSIFVEAGLDDYDFRGLNVWIDDIYMKKFGSATGDNLIKDGSIEISKPEDLGTTNQLDRNWFEKYTLASPAGGAGDVSIAISDRKSGTHSLALTIPSSGSYGAGGEVISVGTQINFTDLLSCYDYWTPEYHESLPNGGFSKVGFEPFLFPVTMTTYTKEKFYVGSSFTIGNSETLTFTGCDLVFAPGVEITIESGGTLNINPDVTNPITRSHLFSCDEMWKGIIVEDGGILNIDGFITGSGLRNCKISDAETAIYCPGNSSGTDVPTLTLIAVDFSNNLISIGAENVDLGIADIVGCNFNATSGMLTKIPHEGVYPQNHIKLENVSEFLIGTGTSINLLNEFSGVQMGVFANESSLSVNGSVFDNLINYSVSPTQKGIGINAQNSTTTPRTLEVDSRFRNLQRGIFTRGNFDVNIHDCDQFWDIDGEAISINSMNYDRSITIINNLQFERNNIGIRVSGGRLNSVTISNNHFDNSGFVETSNGAFHNTAITVQKWSSHLGIPVTGVAEIFNNGILNHRNGIHAINIENVRIGGYDGSTSRPNTISYNLSNSALSEIFHGIWIQNCNKADILANDIENNDPTTETNLRGIVVENSDNANIGCNNIGQMGRAMQFEGLCMGTPGTQLVKNVMTNYEIGIELNVAQIPPQGEITNPWDNEWVNADLTKNKIDGLLLTPSQLIDWYFQGTDGDDTNPFVPSPRGTGLLDPNHEVDPSSPSCANANRIGAFDRDLSWGPVVTDTASYLVEYADELSHLFRQHVYDQLCENDSLLTIGSASDSLFQSFYDQMDSTNTGRFGRVVVAIDSSMIDTAVVLLDGITGSNTIETNRKLVFSILTNKVLVDSVMSSTDTTSLENIVSLHWLYTGDAVYEAAGALGYEYHSPEISLRMQNSQISIQQPSDTSLLTTIPVSIHPNPTGTSTYVSVETTKAYRLELFDMFNRLVQVQHNNPV